MKDQFLTRQLLTSLHPTPENGVVVTCDDGFYTNYFHRITIIGLPNDKGMIPIINNYGNPSYIFEYDLKHYPPTFTRTKA
jgi:hypothetical protein